MTAGSTEVLGPETELTSGASRSGARPMPAHPAAISMHSTAPILAIDIGRRSTGAFGIAGARSAIVRDDPQTAVK